MFDFDNDGDFDLDDVIESDIKFGLAMENVHIVAIECIDSTICPFCGARLDNYSSSEY